jgi:hypothetical protein
MKEGERHDAEMKRRVATFDELDAEEKRMKNLKKKMRLA